MSNAKKWWQSHIIWTAIVSLVFAFVKYAHPNAIDTIINYIKLLMPNINTSEALISLVASVIISFLLIVFRVTSNKQIK